MTESVSLPAVSSFEAPSFTLSLLPQVLSGAALLLLEAQLYTSIRVTAHAATNKPAGRALTVRNLGQNAVPQCLQVIATATTGGTASGSFRFSLR